MQNLMIGQRGPKNSQDAPNALKCWKNNCESIRGTFKVVAPCIFSKKCIFEWKMSQNDSFWGDKTRFGAMLWPGKHISRILLQRCGHDKLMLLWLRNTLRAWYVLQQILVTTLSLRQNGQIRWSWHGTFEWKWAVLVEAYLEPHTSHDAGYAFFVFFVTF